jgi:hypothetical protein
MASSPNLDDITRILDLIATPLALEVLDGLSCGRPPTASAPPECDPATIEAALDVLSAVGAIERQTGRHALSDPVWLTLAGEGLLDALRIADQISDIKYPYGERRGFRNEIVTSGRRSVQFAENLDNGVRFSEP